MKRILVTGGAGYIGTHTCVELIKKGYEVVAVDNYVNSSEESIKRVEKITGKEVKIYNADVRNKSALDKIFTEQKIDWVIHFAGLKAVGESCAKPIEYYDNNLNGTLTLLQSMREHGCKKIVFSSSATVYGDPEELPLTEASKTGGTTNPYGTSKYFQEIMLSDVYKSDKEWNGSAVKVFQSCGRARKRTNRRGPERDTKQFNTVYCKGSDRRVERDRSVRERLSHAGRYGSKRLYPRNGPCKGSRSGDRKDRKERYIHVQSGYGQGIFGA